jgi:O-glycosyl hydrolase
MKKICRPHVYLFGALITASLLLTSLVGVGLRAQSPPPAQGTVQFDHVLRDWDGFGVNYVELCNVRSLDEYKTKYHQDYGGFSTLSEAKRQEIEDLIFGPDGIKPGLVKMFLDPLQEQVKGEFDHETTTKWMRYFVREGLKRTRAQGGDLQILTTMYGPPAWATKQKFLRGRDLDPTEKDDLAQYMIDWAKWLRDHEGFPVTAISLHNEGEGFNRWPVDGSTPGLSLSMDYDMWWPTTQVVDFLRFMRPMMDQAGLKDVALTPGETSNWGTFGSSYAPYIYADPVAIKNIGLVTSHGFGLGPRSINSLGIDTLRQVRPDLHAWTTSTTFVPGRRTDTEGPNIFIEMMRQNIYDAKVNGIIPWSIIQSDPWALGDPRQTNWSSWVGTGIWVDGKGGYEIDKGYYLYKQISRAGQPGMGVAAVSSSDPDIGLIAFARHGTRNPDALVVNNLGGREREVTIRISGTSASSFEAVLTDTDNRKYYQSLGNVSLNNGSLVYVIPAQSVVTFFAK